MTFNEALVDKDIIQILHKATRKFIKVLDTEEIQQCKCVGIWNAVKDYDASKSGIRTFVYNHVVWECQKLIRSKGKKTPILQKSTSVTLDLFTKLSILLPEYEYSLIHKRFIENKTYKEICDDCKITVSQCRKDIKKTFHAIKKALS